MEFYEKLFQALKRDNLKEFASCMETSNCGALRLGRFPVLSVMYLYKSRRLLHAYEKSFLKHNSWRDVGEPMELAAKFRGVAGKCLRFYLSETVSPVEMLLLLNRDHKVKKVFWQAHVTPPVKQRLKDIYFVKWGLQVQFVRNKIVFEARPMTRTEKLHWLTCAVCALLCVVLVVGSPFVVNAFAPFITDANGEVPIRQWKQINFASGKSYALTQDVTVPNGFFVDKMNCTINGYGHTVTVEGNGVFGELNGQLTDVIFETNGSPIAQSVGFRSQVDNVTVNVTASGSIDQARGFFANDNYGTVLNTTVNATGILSVDTGSGEFNCGGIVASNKTTEYGGKTYGASLHDCTANFDGFTLQGQSQVNAAFGGIVGTNDGFVQDCKTSGAIVADTFDVAGICAENNYRITRSENAASVTQRTDSTAWNTQVAGIALTNQAPNGRIEGCINRGQLCAQSYSSARVGGIAASCSSTIITCLSTGSVQATGKSCTVGGIVAFIDGKEIYPYVYIGSVLQSIAACDIKVTLLNAADRSADVGGIVGLMQQWQLSSGYTTGVVQYAYFTGSVEATADSYAGAIVGAVGKNAYDASNNAEDNKKLFYGNAYATDCGASSAFGAAFTVVGEQTNYAPVTDIGATAFSAADFDNDDKYKSILQQFNLMRYCNI